MIVLDSSVALKWIFADEDGAEHAERIRNEHISGKNEIAVPSLFFYEIANVLATKVKISTDEALEAFELISAFEFNVHELDVSEYMEAMTLAMKQKVSVYDACYHLLASRLGCHFFTADRKFWEKVRGFGVAELQGR
ncbi:MAG TPA: type II toxin-antitoxin system VapC family toxin [Desulfuromonadales bacterium]|nr:type II toxin-antitoxin system VapC family toxin [Desulfuromonadales bacterium]